jgi:hypothetical protein
VMNGREKSHSAIVAMKPDRRITVTLYLTPLIKIASVHNESPVKGLGNVTVIPRSLSQQHRAHATQAARGRGRGAIAGLRGHVARMTSPKRRNAPAAV